MLLYSPLSIARALLHQHSHLQPARMISQLSHHVISPEPRRPQLRSTKAALTLTPSAIDRLHILSSGPSPQLIRIGVRNKGCAGMSYHLEYVDSPGKFDEVVIQDGVKVLIDSKALFSIIGSEMDWSEDRISSRFSFKNPNVRDSCGCGESFTT